MTIVTITPATCPYCGGSYIDEGISVFDESKRIVRQDMLCLMCFRVFTEQYYLKYDYTTYIDFVGDEYE